MGHWTDLGVVILAALIQAGLQFGVGAMVALYHESARKHVVKQTRSLVSSFLAGAGTLTFLALATVTFVIANFFGGPLEPGVLAITVGILVGFAVVMWLFYYRTDVAGALWLPRPVANFVNARARTTESNTEAFSLGVLTMFGEAPFVIVLMILAGSSIADFGLAWRPVVVALYTVITIAPLVAIRSAVHNGHSAQLIEKWRLRNRVFLMVTTGLGFLVLAGFILAFRILGN
jgi:hypothetical protein